MAETTTYITVQQKYRSLLKSCKNLISTEDIRLVRKAFDTAMSSEANSQAVTEKDIHRLLDIGLIITSEIGLGRTSIICLMLHRAIESGTLRLEQIKTVFGEKVAQILAGLRDISHIYTTHRVVDSENFRKLLLSFAEDVRVQLIFLAEKLYDLRHAETLLPERQRELARETSYIYIPFAHRLGLYNIKSEMEDLALRYGEPEVYKEISLKLEGTREAREKYINEFIAPIVEEFNNRGIKFKVKWRTKTIASILNKMRKKQVEFEEIYDIFAVRFILDSRGPIAGGHIRLWPTGTRLTRSDCEIGFQCLSPMVMNHCRPPFSDLITDGWKCRFVRNGWMRLLKRDLRLTGSTRGERRIRRSRSG